MGWICDLALTCFLVIVTELTCSLKDGLGFDLNGVGRVGFYHPALLSKLRTCPNFENQETSGSLVFVRARNELGLRLTV